MNEGGDLNAGAYYYVITGSGKKGWNGKYQNTGEYVQNDVYSWSIRLVDVNGTSHEASGKVTVIR